MPNRRGVDLSHFNDPVDFGTLKASGVEFVALKATQGAGYVDPTFLDRQAGARLVGFKHLLFYHFFDPKAGPMAQALSFARVVRSRRPGEAVVIDVERAEGWEALHGGAGVDAIDAFVYHLKGVLGLSAKDVVLYGSLGWLRAQFGGDLARLTYMRLWAARYAPDLGDVGPWPKATIWQNSERGTVPGAGSPGAVDTDVWLDPEAWA